VSCVFPFFSPKLTFTLCVHDLADHRARETRKMSAEFQPGAEDFQSFPNADGLEGVAQTLLISLAARAADARLEKPILGDKYALDAVESIDYDFTRSSMSEAEAAAVAVRTTIFDQWTSSFVSQNPTCTIIHLGCGLDSRAQRIAWGANVHWFDIDLPEAITLRRKVLPTSYQGRSYAMIGADIRQEEWLTSLPRDRPTALVMEGLLSYLKPDEVESLIARIVRHFHHGNIMMDCISSLVLSAGPAARPDAVLRTGADFQSAIDDPITLERKHEGVKVLEAIRFVEAPGVEKLPLMTRVRMYIVSWIPGLRDASRLLRLSFGQGQHT
jgi:methyltransferase (TIGR00027 family)